MSLTKKDGLQLSAVSQEQASTIESVNDLQVVKLLLFEVKTNLRFIITETENKEME